jgi:hypothetical protein
MENEIKKSNWTKFIEAFIGTFKDKTGKGSASRMSIFTCLGAMIYIMVAEQSYSLAANMKIFEWWTLILICLLGINGPIVEVLDALGKFVQVVKGFFRSDNKIEPPKTE